MKKRACACVCQKKVVPLQPVFELRIENLNINRYEYYR